MTDVECETTVLILPIKGTYKIGTRSTRN